MFVSMSGFTHSWEQQTCDAHLKPEPNDFILISLCIKILNQLLICLEE